MSMSVYRFNLSSKILLFFIGYKIYIITVLPGASFVKNVSYYLDIFLLLIYLILVLDIKVIIKLKLLPANTTTFFLLLTLIMFIISTFYINISYALNLQAMIKTPIYILLFLSLFFSFPQVLVRNEDLFEKFLNYLIGISILSAFFSILSLHFGYNSENRIISAAIGFFNHTNTTAFIYSLVIPIVIYKYFSKRISLYGFIAMLGLFCYCLIFTLSRAGMMSVLLSVLFLTYFKSRKIFYITVILMLILSFSFLIDILALKTDSSLSRGLLIFTAVNMLTRGTGYLLWGYGVTNVYKVFDEEKRDFGNFETNVNNPHNFLLMLSIQFGIMVLLPYLAFLFVLLKNAIKIKTNMINNNTKLRLELCIAYIMGLILHNMFEELIIIPEFPFMPISLVFMGYMYYQIKGSKKNINQNTLEDLVI